MLQIQPVEKLIQIDGLVTGLDVVRPRDFYYSGEAHDFWEAVLVCEGRITVTGDERLHHLDEGMVAFHKPMEFHRLWTEGNVASHLMIISFRASGPGAEQLKNRCFRLTEAERNQFAQITAGINKAVLLRETDRQEERRRLISLTATRLEMLLHELTDLRAVVPAQLSEEEQRYMQILSVMKAHCCESMTVEELARICDMSVSNLKRVFSQFSGVGIAKYFLSLKMCRAMEMLDTGMRAGQVAAELNYPEPSYFFTVFKREIGMTPRQYQKSGNIARGLLRQEEL